MKHVLPSARSMSIDIEAEKALFDFDSQWRLGSRPDLDRYIAGLGDLATPSMISALAKIDLQYRLERGEAGDARSYLDRFPLLATDGERALSLIYEEFCLLADAGAAPAPGSFCERYATWGDSLASQLEYHRVLSIAAGPRTPTKFPKPGERFQKFDLDRVLGQGGSAKVYLARDSSLGGRKFVLKVSQDRGAEPSILGKLTHRNIVPVHSVAVEAESGLRGLCMPYLPGISLDELIRRISRGKLPRKARQLWALIIAGAEGVDQACAPWPGYPIGKSYADGVAWIMQKIADALAYAHEEKVLHRDVKPANIWLSFEQGPLLLDFNLAHAPSTAEEAEVALRGGTLPYMAPEQIRAFLSPDSWDQVGPKADIYAVGLMLREMLSGRSPDHPNSRLPLPRALQEMLDRRSLPLSSIRLDNPDVPHALAEVVNGCLEFQAEQRYPSARELADDLGCFLDRQAIKNRPNPSRLESVSNWMERNQRGRKAAVAAAVIIPLLLLFSNYASHFFQLRQAISLLHSQNYKDAVTILGPLREASPDSVPIQIYLAIALDHLLQTGESDKLFNLAAKDKDSIPIFVKELKYDPKSTTLQMALAKAYFIQEDYDKAIDWYGRVAAQSPDYWYAWQGLMAAHNKKKETRPALVAVGALFEAIHRLQTTKPEVDLSRVGVEYLVNFFGTERNLIDQLVDGGDFDEAEQAYDRFDAQLSRITIEGGRTADHNLLFELYAITSDIDRAKLQDRRKALDAARSLWERAATKYRRISVIHTKSDGIQKLDQEIQRELMGRARKIANVQPRAGENGRALP